MSRVTRIAWPASTLSALLVLLFASGCTEDPDDGPLPDSDTPPGDTGPIDTQPSDAQPSDMKPPIDAQPIDAQPADSGPCDAPVGDLVLGAPCALGLGACRAEGVVVCTAEGLACDAVPGEPSPESCDGIDDDCDDAIDEGFDLGAACAAGEGACRAEGGVVCIDGEAGCDAVPGEPSPEACDGIDDDCDGATDEGFDVGAACAAGEGACRAAGGVVCIDGEAGCDAAPGAPSPEACDGIDNDCDGAVDEGFGLGAPCAAGEGDCRRQGSVVCIDGEAGCDARARPPSPEDCNGIDDDCDGAVDEGIDIVADPNNCGGCGVACNTPCEACEGGSCAGCDGSADCGASQQCVLANRRCAGVEQAYLKAPNAGPADDLGFGLVAGRGWILAGARREPGDAASTLEAPNRDLVNAGAAYLFERRAGAWVTAAYLKASDAAARDGFGTFVERQGDRIVISSPNRMGQGSLYIFERAGDRWTQVWRPPLGPDSGSPSTLTLDGDRLYVGEGGRLGTADCPDSESAGALLVFERSPGGRWSRTGRVEGDPRACGSEFGSPVIAADDLLVVGAAWESGDAASTLESPNRYAPRSGAVGVFARQPDGRWQQTQYLKADDPVEGAYFGAALALSGSRLVVGAPFGPSNAVYVFEPGPDDRWRQTARLTPAFGPAPGFGYSVAIDGDRIVVGAYREPGDADSVACAPNAGLESAGAVFVFDRQRDGRWVEVAYLKARNAVAAGFANRPELGQVVALVDHEVIASAHGEPGDAQSTLDAPNGDANGAGAVYVFGGPPPVCAGPPGPEVCDGHDDDCDGRVDEGADGQPLTTPCYGGPEGTAGVGACVEGARTCRHGRWGACAAAIEPVAELCNLRDDDCDGATDEGCREGDFDFDGRSPADGDCDDADPGAFPGNAEVCDGEDNDCDGVIDHPGCLDRDDDRDGFTPATGDCDDLDPAIAPYADELCDGVDDDCDTLVDEGAACPEICDNGVDDNNDGLIDCADARCGCPEICDNGMDDNNDGRVDCAEEICFIGRRCQPDAPCGARPCPAGRVCEAGACVIVGSCARPLPLGDGPVEGALAGPSGYQQASCGSTTGPELVYRLRVDVAGTYCVATTRSSFDSVVYVRTDCADPATEVACNDIGGLPPRAAAGALTLEAEAGIDYFVFVDAARNGEKGPFVLEARPGPCGP